MAKDKQQEQDTTSKIIKGVEEKILKEIVNFWEGKDEETILTPKLTDNYRNLLAAWFERYSTELAQIEKRYPTDWIKLRKTVKSVKEADMRYNSTSDGQRRIELKFKLKSLEKNISALKDRLRRFELESFNRY